MPVVGSGAYDTVSDILPVVQSLLNDQRGQLFVANKVNQAPPAGTINIVPYANTAYRKIQRSLANIGTQTFVQDDVRFIVPAVTLDPAGQTIFDDSSVNVPQDLLVPLKLWERQSGSSDDFVEMIDMTEKGGLPSEPQGMALRFWAWQTDGLAFLGALQDREVRMRYEKQLSDLTDENSPIMIRGCRNAMVMFTAALISASRGSPLAAQWDQAGDDALQAMLVRETRKNQATPVRRRPFSYRSGNAYWF